MAKGRLQKTAEGVEAVRRILVNTIWVAIILIVLSAAGWYLVRQNVAGDATYVTQPPAQVVKPTAPVIDWNEVDSSLAAVLQSAREKARSHAEAELDQWITSLMTRVDESFLDWYFSYWTQQMLGLKGLYQYGVHYVISELPTASEKLTEEIQEEFTNRVLQPQVAQRKIERIINETAEVYLLELHKGLEKIPQQYEIGRAQWQEYLQDIAITAQAAQGSRQTPLTLKALTVAGGGGAVLLAGNMKGLVGKIGSKVLTKSSGKAASAMAAKTGGKVVAKAGGKFFGTIVGFGVLIWDIWDHNTNERENRPFLRLALKDYFAELKIILLDDPEYGIMSTFRRLELEAAGRRTNGHRGG